MKDKKIQKDEGLKGVLYIVGTPIGNLKDITIRAVETLKLVDVILAEDTRQTMKLLNHLEISKQLISYHRHNEVDKIEEVKRLLDENKKIALVSDAGMPRISDPGESLIQDLIQNGYDIEVIPGVTAITTALVMTSLPTETFVFEGFLPMRVSRRKERLKKLKYETRTIVFYEAPHKILYTLKDILKEIGDRNICVCRELTKIHEEYRHSTVSKQIERIEKEGVKGEIVLIVEGCKDGDTIKAKEEETALGKDVLSDKELVERYINEGIDKKEAIKKVAKERGKNKNEVYMECVKND